MESSPGWIRKLVHSKWGSLGIAVGALLAVAVVLQGIEMVFRTPSTAETGVGPTGDTAEQPIEPIPIVVRRVDRTTISVRIGRFHNNRTRVDDPRVADALLACILDGLKETERQDPSVQAAPESSGWITRREDTARLQDHVAAIQQTCIHQAISVPLPPQPPGADEGSLGPS